MRHIELINIAARLESYSDRRLVQILPGTMAVFSYLKVYLNLYRERPGKYLV
jgi:hypothetical protein